MYKNLLSTILKSLGNIANICRILTILLVLGFFVASHTVTTVAALTSTAITAVAGAGSTVMGRSSIEAHKMSTKNARLQNSLEIEKKRVAKLSKESAALRNKDLIRIRGRTTTVKKASSEVLNRVAKRTVRATATNLSSIPGESIPFYGIAIILAATAYELQAACANMKDIYELQVAINPDVSHASDRDTICAMKIPTKQEIWESVKGSPNAAWQSSREKLLEVSDDLKSVEMPTFSRMWKRFAGLIGARLP
ncbi:hypothetical protein [Neptunicoccus cionae]|uniref:Uncharacterized protein n=1 Tax=Neptunicoccus cionae TaxID=2035344 RepID=A0A916QYW6_9RHOB|nr:hypothetical protein [Amylibacter cionae]GGA24439.1 hypothetical protein GCM10011498_26800 [Amylibacter cionae]